LLKVQESDIIKGHKGVVCIAWMDKDFTQRIEASISRALTKAHRVGVWPLIEEDQLWAWIKTLITHPLDTVSRREHPVRFDEGPRTEGASIAHIGMLHGQGANPRPARLSIRVDKRLSLKIQRDFRGLSASQEP